MPNIRGVRVCYNLVHMLIEVKERKRVRERPRLPILDIREKREQYVRQSQLVSQAPETTLNILHSGHSLL